MATPAPTTDQAPDPAEQLAEFNCQTEDCPNPFRVVSFMVGDSTAQFHCLACWMAWNVAIIEKLTEQGLIEPPGSS